ncbi:MAG: porin [Aeromonadales bacterium]|nr:porin [Aeromonadales bacterium]MDY2891261.1 porin [Succinivibrio sp.]
MKKSLIAIAIAAFAAASANAATVYDKNGTQLDIGGRVQAVWHSARYDSVANGDQAIENSARLNIAGRTEIANGISGFGFTEWDAADNNGTDNSHDTFETREQYVGVDFGKFGTVTAGRTYDAVKSVIETTDIFEDYGCVGQPGSDDWRTGTVRYNWSGYGFDFGASYGFAVNNAAVGGSYAGETEDRGTMNINNSFSVMAGWTSPDVLFGPISVKAGYAYIRGQNDKDALSFINLFDDNGDIEEHIFRDRNMREFAAAITWGSLDSGLYAGVMFDGRRFSVASDFDGNEHHYSLKGVEAVVNYAWDCGISLAVGYEYNQVSFDGGDGFYGIEHTSAAKRKVPVYLNYAANENFNVWLEAQFDAGTDHDGFAGEDGLDLSDEALYAVGARYTF